MKKITLTLVIFLISQFAIGSAARVIIVRGKVTMLKPGALEAENVQRGETLPEDTSIKTGAKSFVKLKFADKSSINLGPNSKMVVAKLPKEKANMVNFLTGVMRAEVKKQRGKKKDSVKLMVKTRNAVMGVRGTKFQSTYNPANHNTSLVTVEGKVSMAKIKKDPIIEANKQMASNAGKSAAKKSAVKKVSNESVYEALEKSLESKNTVNVEPGRYSGISDSTKVATEPVKIAPKQYDAIAKATGSTKNSKDIIKMEKSGAISDSASHASAKSAAKTSVRAGGYIDIQTGLYVPPPKTAEYDAVNHVYKTDENLGDVDPETGDYVPPEGVKIDAIKGLVVKDDASDEVKRTIALANKDIKKNIPDAVNKSNKKLAAKKRNKNKKKHSIYAGLMPFSYQLDIENTYSDDTSTFLSSNATMIAIGWEMKINRKWSTLLEFTNASIEIDEVDDVEFNEYNGESDYSTTRLGANYQYNKKLQLYFGYMDEEVPVIMPDYYDGDTSVVYIDDVSVKSLEFGADYEVKKIKKITGSVYGGLYHTFDKDYGDEGSYNGGWGLKLRNDWDYKISKRINLVGSIYYSRIKNELDYLEFKRSTFGTGVNLNWNI